MPLVMATSSMVLRAPMFRVKEKAKVWFMEQSRKQMLELKLQQMPKNSHVSARCHDAKNGGQEKII